MAYDEALNADILAWLDRQPRDRPRGDGECWTLAEDALIDVHAQTSRSIMRERFGPQAAYVWGDPEPNMDNVRPGDIIQFSRYQAVLTRRVVTDLDPAPGRVQGVPLIVSRPHHTAIVLRVLRRGQLVEIIEQNVARLPGPGSPQASRVVQVNPLALVSTVGLPSTVMNSSGYNETTTISYAVTPGHLTVYHPRRAPSPVPSAAGAAQRPARVR